MKIIKTIRDSDFGLNIPDPKVYKEYKAARGIVFDRNGNVALLHSKKRNYHMLPGGGIENGEEIIDAFKREMLEEIGCNVKNIKELGITEEFCNKIELHHLAYYFIADLDGKVEIPKFEEDEALDDFETLWLKIDDAIKILEKEIVTIDHYKGKFINTRDIICLKEARKLLINNRED